MFKQFLVIDVHSKFLIFDTRAIYWKLVFTGSLYLKCKYNFLVLFVDYYISNYYCSRLMKMYDDPNFDLKLMFKLLKPSKTCTK